MYKIYPFSHVHELAVHGYHQAGRHSGIVRVTCGSEPLLDRRRPTAAAGIHHLLGEEAHCRCRSPRNDQRVSVHTGVVAQSVGTFVRGTVRYESWLRLDTQLPDGDLAIVRGFSLAVDPGVNILVHHSNPTRRSLIL